MIGILAYGSLVDDPGCEVEPLIIRRVNRIRTPFPIEFARSSSTRDGAPTLIPVSQGGSTATSTILVLAEEVSETQAVDILWRRETRRASHGQGYPLPTNPGVNTVLVEKLNNFEGVGSVLYTRIGSNINELTPQNLAELAIGSALGNAGAEGKDGVAYLIAAKRNGIGTPLMPTYESEILRLTGTSTLEAAREALVGDKSP